MASPSASLLIKPRQQLPPLFCIAFRGELTSHHPLFHPASPAASKDIDIKTAKQLLPDSLTVGIHMGAFVAFFTLET